MVSEKVVFCATLIFNMASGVFARAVIEESEFSSSFFTMECPPGQGIRTRGVYYGKDSEGCNSKINKDENTLKVARKCDLRRKCEVPATNSLFGDPCLGTKKELDLDYECVSGIHSDFAWEHGTVHLGNCPNGKVIKILNVFYGRNILTCDSTPTAKSRVEIKCDGHQSCAVPANNVLFGDPCYGVVKYLDVSYSCVGSQDHRREVHLQENTKEKTVIIETEKTSAKDLTAIDERKLS